MKRLFHFSFLAFVSAFLVCFLLLTNTGKAFAQLNQAVPYQIVHTSQGVIKSYQLQDIRSLSRITHKTVENRSIMDQSATHSASLNQNGITGAATMTFWYYNDTFLCASVFVSASDPAAASMVAQATLAYGGSAIAQNVGIGGSAVFVEAGCSNAGTGLYMFTGFVVSTSWFGNHETAVGGGEGVP